ncbi:Uncharacterized protein DAT39_013216 [Clarias magur]|uniref:Uncharacterized protein n=1 Tax=Clarias magur TaxID=1594786 RepID=A0A8J4U249_CLAMG|nr:Uncharacterized protein DAT39_013216 [Clarias magur]
MRFPAQRHLTHGPSPPHGRCLGNTGVGQQRSRSCRGVCVCIMYRATVMISAFPRWLSSVLKTSEKCTVYESAS